MKKQLRLVLFAVMVLLMITVTAVAASAATPFSTGENSYATLEEAVAAVSDGGIVTVTENVTLSADVTLSSAVAYTIKGSAGAETITFTSGGLVITAGTVTIENITIVAEATNTVTLKNSATKLTVKDGARIESKGTSDITGLSVTLAGFSTLTVEGGTFYGAIGATDTIAAAGAYITINNGTFYPNSNTPAGQLLRTNRARFSLTITGGTFNYTSKSTSSSALLYSNSNTATVTITGGTFTATGNTPAPLLYCGQGTYSISGGNFYSYITGQKTDTAPVLYVSGSETATSKYTVSGGCFYACGSSYSYPVYVRACTSMKITGGFYTYADTLASPDDINLTKADGDRHLSSNGYNSCFGVYIATAAPVRISGGTFMGGASYSAFTVGSCVADVVISSGTFYGHRAVDTYATGGTLTIVGGSFYPNPGQANAKLLDLRSAAAVVNVYGGTFNANYTAAGNISGGGVIYFEKAGKLNIYGGTFSCNTTASSGSLIRLATAGTVQIGTGSYTLDSATYTGEGPVMTKNGVGALIRLAADGASAVIDAGSFTVGDTSAAIYGAANGTATVNNGSFIAGDTATVVYTTAICTITVNGGTFTAGDTATVMHLSHGNITVNGGTFKGTGACIFELALPKDAGSFEIAGGTFTLGMPTATVAKGGAIIRTGMGVIAQNAGQYYDPTDMYCISSADILLSGGVFVDDRTTNNQIIDATLGESCVIVDGAVLLSRYSQAYFIDVNDAIATDILMTPNAAICTYNGNTYYCYIGARSKDSGKAPVMEVGAAVTITTSYEGIRFASEIPAEVVAALPAGYTFGTLIAPADYVVAAGGFTHALLGALQASTPSLGTVYVDIVAKNSIRANTDGSISFSGALIALQEKNYTRSLAAVSYILSEGVYYYSTYDAAENARSMAYVAKEAYTSVADIPDEQHLNYSIYKLGAFSAYTETEQGILKTYSAYTHTWDSATVTPSTNISVGTDASANLQAASTALGTTLSGLGYSTSGAAILVGNTGDAEIATALSEIEGQGYYIGAINGKIVIVGTTNALTMQALAYFEETCLADAASDGSLILWERVNSNVKMISLGSDTSFVFQHTRDGNTIEPYTSSTRLNANIAFNTGSNHLYNYEDNPEFVDYPVVAAMEIGAVLDGSASNYCYVPDNLQFGEYTIHVGITELALETLLAGKDVGYYGYAIKDGNIIISSFDDATLRLAKELFLADAVDFVTESGTYMMPADYACEKGYSDGFTGAFNNYSDDATIQAGADYVAAELALLVTDFPRPADLQLSGAVNVDSNSLELYYQNATAADYTAYCALLEANGYTAYMAERKVEGNYFVTYYNATTNITLHVMYNAYLYAERETMFTGTQLSEMFTPTLRVIAAKVDGSNINLLPEEFLRVSETGKLTDSKLTVVQIHQDNVGFCYVYTLEDGTFVVLDGGGGSYTTEDATNLYNVLTELHTEIHGSAPTASNPIVIAAWYISHGHGDHYPMMQYFINTYCNQRKTFMGIPYGDYISVARVNAVIGNFASNDEIYNSMDPNQTLPNKIGTDNWYKTNGVAIPYYKVHTGQQFFIGNLEFEVIYTHEDIHPWGMIYFNNTSTVIRLTVHNTDGKGNIIEGSTSISNMALGDLQARGSMVMRATWGDYLKSDIVLSAHHGGNGIEGECYELINAQIILWSNVAEGVDGLWSATSTSAYVSENREWLANTRWYYIFTVRAYEKTLSSDEYYNLTMTITENGIAGLYEGGDDEFIAGLTNIAGGSADTTLSYGTGIFDGSDSYTGDGYLVHRDNFEFEMPVVSLPGDIDGDFDEFGGVATIPN